MTFVIVGQKGTELLCETVLNYNDDLVKYSRFPRIHLADIPPSKGRKAGAGPWYYFSPLPKSSAGKG